MADVTVYTDEDEWYPVWSAQRAAADGTVPYGDPLVVDAATADRWERVFREFDEVQDEIGEAVAEAGKSKSA